MKEQDLASKLIPWLEEQHWDVYQEVQFFPYGSIADIAAVRDGKLLIVECKNTLSIAVMRQASLWRAHYRLIAVPISRNLTERGFAYDICKNYLKIGVIEITKSGEIYKEVPSPLMREYHAISKKKILRLKEEHKIYAKAGSNSGGYYTPYRGTMDKIKRFIKNNPGCTLKEIMDEIGKGHYSSNIGARSSIRKALEFWEDWCRIEKDDKKYKYFVKE